MLLVIKLDLYGKYKFLVVIYLGDNVYFIKLFYWQEINIIMYFVFLLGIIRRDLINLKVKLIVVNNYKLIFLLLNCNFI